MAAVHETVSDPDDLLILVNDRDEEQGFLSKRQCHVGDGTLHRAFSVFILDGSGKVLLQRRGPDKQLWPGFWSNSCCSHPRKGEEMTVAVERRLGEELGMAAHVEFLYKFRYQARYLDKGSEHELCWVWVGTTEDTVQANANEIEEWRFITPTRLDEELQETPQAFTPWMKMEWQKLREDYPRLW